jgi:hypothetical protein
VREATGEADVDGGRDRARVQLGAAGECSHLGHAGEAGWGARKAAARTSRARHQPSAVNAADGDATPSCDVEHRSSVQDDSESTAASLVGRARVQGEAEARRASYFG